MVEGMSLKSSRKRKQSYDLLTNEANAHKRWRGNDEYDEHSDEQRHPDDISSTDEDYDEKEDVLKTYHDWVNKLDRGDLQMMAMMIFDYFFKQLKFFKTRAAEEVAKCLGISDKTVRIWRKDFITNHRSFKSKDDKQKSMLARSECDVDFASVFAVLSSQFEASCQLQAAGKGLKSSSEDNPSSLSGWFEHSKKLQWRRSTTSSPGATVSDFERMKDNSAENISSVAQSKNVSSDELYDKWLMPQEDMRNVATISSDRLPMSRNESNTDEVTSAVVTNAKVNSDSSSQLLHSLSDHDISVKQNDCFNADTSPWLLQSSLSVKEDNLPAPPDQDWLNQKMEDNQTCLTVDSQQNNLPQQGHSCIEGSNKQWLLPRDNSSLNNEALPPGGDSGDDMHSDMFKST